MEKSREREPYERPKVIRVRIVSGEMAVTGCKTPRTRQGPTIGCQASNCRSVGS
jgi:hypothetical protein